MRTTQEVRETHSGVANQVNGRVAVIVETQVSKRKRIFGVQFWTSDMVSAGISINTDGSASAFKGFLRAAT